MITYQSDINDRSSARNRQKIYVYKKARFQPDSCYVLVDTMIVLNKSKNFVTSWCDRMNRINSWTLDIYYYSPYEVDFDHGEVRNIEINIQLDLPF